MIHKQEILVISSEKSLRPDIVEKDYILGWLLAGIFAHELLSKTWIFKGGTCLKKCYFDTYRFSEDLDFTLSDSSHIEKAFLNSVFAEITEWIYERSGIEFPAGMQSFDIFTNPRGNLSCQGKVSYRGPVSPKPFPRVKLDITNDECIVLPPVKVPVFHPYSDVNNAMFNVQTYAYEEVFGEKVRALAERTSPRDLYDVVNLFRNESARPDPAILRDVIKQKCEFKKISMPDLNNILSQRDSLEAGWQQMLRHQLPILPELQGFLDELPLFFDWLYNDRSIQTMKVFPSENGDISIRDRAFNFNLSQRGRSALEIIRFAAANRLCVNLEYVDGNGSHSKRRIEPYSARKSKDGNNLLAAVRRENGAARTYRFDRIIDASVTNESFIPRYEIELVPNLPFVIKPLTQSAQPTGSFSMKSRSSQARSYRAMGGPIHIYLCPICKKTFKHKNRSPSLKRHKDKNGHACHGRLGIFVESKC